MVTTTGTESFWDNHRTLGGVLHHRVSDRITVDLRGLAASRRNFSSTGSSRRDPGYVIGLLFAEKPLIRGLFPNKILHIEQNPKT